MRTLHPSRLLAAAAVLAAGMAVLPGAATADPQADAATARAVVRNVDGAVLGTLTLTLINGKLAVAGRLSGLTAGFHGFHIHAVGLCDPRATDPAGTVVPFLSAGGHLNPAGTGHGQHGGDLPVLLVGRNGRTVTATETDAVTLAQIFDADGSAFIVHAGPDNLAHIPTRYSAGGVPGPDAATLATGDAGGRFGCGVITRW